MVCRGPNGPIFVVRSVGKFACCGADGGSRRDGEFATVQASHEARLGHLFVQPLRDGAQELVTTRLPVLSLQKFEAGDLEQEQGDRSLAAISRRQQALQMLEEAAGPWQARRPIVAFVVARVAVIGVPEVFRVPDRGGRIGH